MNGYTPEEHRLHSQRGNTRQRELADERRAAQQRRTGELRQQVRAVVAWFDPLAVAENRVPVLPITHLWVWRALAGETGCTEGDLTRLAQAAGHWPWTPAQIIAANRPPVGGGEQTESEAR